MQRRLRWIALIGIAVLVLASCGSPDDGSGGSADPTQTSATGTGEGSSVSGQAKQWANPPAMELKPNTDYQATLHTNKGDIVIDLLEKEDPITVNNFVFLAEQGYYTNVPFHRVIKGFMIQTGDPTGTGTGGPGYKFQDEPVTRDYERGTVAMANAGPNTNGSQFFIVQADLRGKLQKNYTIFGEVTEGMDVVDAIANVPVTVNPAMGEQSKPTEPVSIQSVDISTK